ncbi:MAG: hypothetical protein PHU08_00090 [Dehalococcoidales bacterium]|nr:hypothetical protein [Dehalococcoidales bacterium]
MKDELVKQIQDLTAELGELVVGLEPKTPAEWEAMERMQAAHKQMRGIAIEELIEQPPRAGLTR